MTFHLRFNAFLIDCVFYQPPTPSRMHTHTRNTVYCVFASSNIMNVSVCEMYCINVDAFSLFLSSARCCPLFVTSWSFIPSLFAAVFFYFLFFFTMNFVAYFVCVCRWMVLILFRVGHRPGYPYHLSLPPFSPWPYTTKAHTLCHNFCLDDICLLLILFRSQFCQFFHRPFFPYLYARMCEPSVSNGLCLCMSRIFFCLRCFVCADATPPICSWIRVFSF